MVVTFTGGQFPLLFQHKQDKQKGFATKVSMIVEAQRETSFAFLENLFYTIAGENLFFNV